MPVVNRTNNRILPPNSRAVDVAQQTIKELTPVQQRKVDNAFRVQGFPGIYYSKAVGQPNCSCVSERRVVNSILDEQGKASPGVINELLTGGSFGVSNYSPSLSVEQRLKKDEELQELVISDPRLGHSIVSPRADHPFDLTSAFDLINEGEESHGRTPLGPDFGDNGPQGFDIDEMLESFDLGAAGFSDFACPVCFGTGISGGYNPMFGTRIVKTAAELGLQLAGHDPGILEIEHRPWVARTSSALFVATLDRGARSLVALNAWAGDTKIPFQLTINGEAVQGVQQFLRHCTGQPVAIGLDFGSTVELTHVELQIQTSEASVYAEFPRMTRASDMAVLDTTDPFQILFSPQIPEVRQEDLFVDSVYGKVMIVQSVSPHQTRSGSQLGWEAQVRVLQPQEVGNLLPRLYRVPTKHKTTQMVTDNGWGHRRT